MTPLPAAPGDVLAVWTGNSPVQDVIRLRDLLDGQPAVANHVIGVTHQDQAGRWMGMEGRPGGFGLADCTPYLADPRTRSNHGQPRSTDQTRQLLAVIAKLTGTPYDWVGIDEEALLGLHLDAAAAELDRLWRFPTTSGVLPGHVFCSNAWAYAYQAVALAHPDAGRERVCTPGDWWSWNNARRWETPA